MKLLINEFAEDKYVIERELSSHTTPIIEHLAKCLLMPNNNSYNHWKKEIIHQICDINKLKSSKKFPKAKQIYNWTYGKKQDIITDTNAMKQFFNNLENDYNIIIVKSIDLLCKVLNEMCIGYFTLLADNLSTFGFLDKSKANKFIDDFVKQYSLNRKEK